MLNHTGSIAPTQIRSYPRFLWFLIMSYSMVIVLENWFDPRLISLFGYATDAGTLIFPLTFLLSDLITEVYGYKHARRAIWCGFLFNLLFIAYGQLVTHMPSPDYAVAMNQQFDELLSIGTRIILASSISYLCSEPLNSYIVAKLKIKFTGKYMGMRFLLSTLAASGIDSMIFSCVAFYGTMTNVQLFNLILTMWIIKVMVELCGLPLSIRLAQYLKQAEHLDVYDKGTPFTIFSLDTNYSMANNAFKS